MIYSKKRNLLNNIRAIRTAFSIEKEQREPTKEEISLLGNFSGFGGLGFILKNAEKESDIKEWDNWSKPYFEDTLQLHILIRENSKNDEEYKLYMDSLKKSTLTAFYTPSPVTRAISEIVRNNNIECNRFLDPSAGIGEFVRVFKDYTQYPVTAFENDLITGKILKLLYPKDDIHVQDFNKLSREYENYFDVASSNIPFGNMQTFDSNFLKSSGEGRFQASQYIHSYFIVKSLDAVREGGISALITSQGFMNSPSHQPVRELLMNNSDLITAVRLPNNLFTENANTLVGTDLIVFQKNTGKQSLSEKEHQFIQTRELPNGITYNNYFLTGENVIYTSMKDGKDLYGKPAIELYHDGGVEIISQEISGIIKSESRKSLDIDKYNRHLVPIQKEIESSEQRKPLFFFNSMLGQTPGEQTQQEPEIDLSPDYFSSILNLEPREYRGVIEVPFKQEMLTADTGQIGYLEKKSGGKILFYPIQLKSDQARRIRDYFPLRDAWVKLYDFEYRYGQENPSLRMDLNEHYKKFVDRHGDLNSRANSQVIMFDSFGRDILSLEYFIRGQKHLANIFNEPVAFSNNQNIVLESAQEGLASSLNMLGYVDIEHISTVCGKEKEEIFQELKGLIYYNPVNDRFEPKEVYLTGNIVEKAEQVEDFIHNNPEHPSIDLCLDTLQALKSQIPEPIPFEDIIFNLGERWIPNNIYTRFASDLLDTKTDIYYFKDVDNFSIKPKDNKTVAIREKHAVNTLDGRSYDGLFVLQNALLNTSPRITKEVTVERKKVRVPDPETTQLVNAKIQAVRDEFNNWLNKQDIEVKDDLADKYNRLFNNVAIQTFDGSFQTLPDLQLAPLGIKELNKGQYDAIWMAKSKNGGLVNIEVGGGKTLIAVIASYEMSRLKLCTNPTILGLKSNIEEIIDTYSKAYPNAKILYPTEKEFEPDHRMNFFKKMVNNNWDAVIMTHDQFIRIQQSEEIMLQLLKEQLYSLENSLETYTTQNNIKATSNMLKGLEKRKINLKAKIELQHEKIENRRDDDINFESLRIGHLFVDESPEFKNVPYVTRYYNVSGLGNPAGSQKAANLEVAVRTLQEKRDSDLCVTFLSGTPIINSLVELYLLLRLLCPRKLEEKDIHSFDAWAAVYARKVTDYEYTATGEIKLVDRLRYFKNVPELSKMIREISYTATTEELKIDRPKNQTILVKLPATDQQKKFIEKLIKFSKTKDASLIGRKPLKQKEKNAIGLIVNDVARKIAIDMRALDPNNYSDDPGNKASACAKQIAEIYNQFDFVKGTQIIFSDISVYRPDKWNVFSEIRDKLVREYGIPAHEIRFMNECKTKEQVKKLKEDLRNGIVRVSGGSTKKFGTGVNIQDRIIADHDIDTPYTPGAVRQRRGRSGRKGNWVAKLHNNNQVKSFKYAHENTHDNYMFNLTMNKNFFIEQIFHENIAVRVIDEGNVSANGDINFEELLAQLSGNKDLVEIQELEREIAILKTERRADENNKLSTGMRISYLDTDIKNKKSELGLLKKDWENFNNNAPKDKDGFRPTDFKLNNFKETALDKIAEKLLDIKNNPRKYFIKEYDYKKIGTVNGFTILTRAGYYDGIPVSKFYIQGNKKYQYNNGYLANDPILAITSFNKALEDIPKIIAEYKAQINKWEKDIKLMKVIVETSWNKEDKLKELEERYTTLKKRLENPTKAEPKESAKKAKTKNMNNSIHVNKNRRRGLA